MHDEFQEFFVVTAAYSFKDISAHGNLIPPSVSAFRTRRAAQNQVRVVAHIADHHTRSRKCCVLSNYYLRNLSLADSSHSPENPLCWPWIVFGRGAGSTHALDNPPLHRCSLWLTEPVS